MSIIYKYTDLAASVEIISVKGKPQLLDYDKSLTLAGTGRSAYVFRVQQTDKAIKVFFPDKTHLAQEEGEIYRTIRHIPYFPALYEIGANYIVIDYIEGYTLFECLTKGIPISEDKILEIDGALQLTRQEGLNPSDIHLRNIFITADLEIKLIDVARFRQTKACSQWEDLKNAFYRYYIKRYFPKKLPEFILNCIALIYKNSYHRMNRRTSSKIIHY